MPWLILLLSAVCEAVWATALGASAGLTRPGPVAVFGVFVTLSMLGLAWALRHIGVGTAYAVWTGVGAALTVTWAMATGAEPAEPIRIALLAGIVVAVIGLKLAGDREPARQDSRADTTAL